MNTWITFALAIGFVLLWLITVAGLAVTGIHFIVKYW